MKKYGVWAVAIPDGTVRKREFVQSSEFQDLTSRAKVKYGVQNHEGKHIGFFSEFETEADEEVLFKAGISFVSEEGARKNLEAELPGWDFEGVRRQAVEQWNEALSKIQVIGGTDEQKHVLFQIILNL